MASTQDIRPALAPALAPTGRPLSPDTPPPRSLLDIFAETVARAGGRVAIDAADAVLTYAQLSDRAGELAERLRSSGVGPGDRVGVRVRSGSADLYTAILGVLMAGAAYVPVDVDDPPARAAEVWMSSGACAVVGDGVQITELHAASGAPRQPALDDDAWVIFTSGSTGKPKAVAVTHRSAAAFVDAETRLWSIGSDDRVLAALSVGFDASCEEMWLAWRNGAALIPASRALVRSGADLGAWLRERGITVVSTVPTLASMWDDADLARVRLLILGGEPCPPQLGWRLAARREVWNTYGPTEATVVSTAARIEPDRPITIGFPLAGWDVAVVDDGGEPVPFGETGELVVAGVGLGRYLDETLEAGRFAALPALGWERAYRTGDVVRETLAGFEFAGRRDDQVKLGGRRLELGEVDARLAAVPGVRAAATAVRETAGGNPTLVGYIVGDVDPGVVRAAVAEQLPAGLAPVVITLDALPTAHSGKVDRKALPWPPPRPAAAPRGRLSGTAEWLAERWTEQLGPLPIAVDSDFFELGGTSVTAAKLVSNLRRRFPSAGVADVYGHRRLGELAARLEELGEAPDEAPMAPASTARRWGALQIVGVLAVLALTAPGWLIGLFAYNDWQGTGPKLAWPVLIVAALLFVSAPGRALLVVAARRALLWDLRPGRYPRRSWLACRVWFVERLAEVFHLERLAGTPLAPALARLAGAEVGRDVRLWTLPAVTALIRIGDGATLEPAVDTHGWWIDGSDLVVGEIRVGPRARVGARSVLMPGADIGAAAEVELGAVITTPVPAGERWAGSPARHVGDAGDSWPATHPPRERHARLWKSMYGTGIALHHVVTLVAALPGIYLIDVLGGGLHSVTGTVVAMVGAAPVIAATFVVTDAIAAALGFRAVARLLRPGWHSADGRMAWALWMLDVLERDSQHLLYPLYASIYTRAWLRLHGVKVGKRTEISHTEGLNPLVGFGRTGFVADSPMLATARTHNGWLQLAPIEIGDRTFIGPGALLGAGTQLGDDCLVGAESQAPPKCADGSSWFGSPPLELPRIPDPTDPARTTHPPRRLVAGRAATELVRIILPASVSIVLGGLILLALESLAGAGGALIAVISAPFVLVAAGACAVAVTVALKWILIGRYRRSQKPFWSFFVWRDEIINSAQEQLAGHWLMEFALGTPLMSLYLRAMGAKIGRDVWCETLAITEFDMVTVRDGSAINRGACLETHLVHDRLLRIGTTDLGAGSTLGPISAVLPDTRLGAGCSVGGRSVVMAGEELPAGSRWHGIPVVAA